MANEDQKDFNAMMNEDKGMPKMQIVTDEATIKRYGGTKMYFAPPLDYNEIMKRIPYGKIITTSAIRDYLAKQNDGDFTEPITAGAFISIAAWASEQRDTDLTPYWRTLKAKGEINPKFPGGVDAQIEKLEAEGHTVVCRGRKIFRYYVENFEEAMYEL
ncbi:MGMT family protein [Enterococcus malodoratus]|uniref:Uncharacterized protein n=1 Tax=Enterococcus malodoratus ATCC 43197 TaxID=1158601 RepID=R2PCM5_9ENTE|nr:MGMT family protein [Enterococcus malodoratus]EOH80968.1 hypothetical protein UAI_01012 [Enterococcus malodoratus ATCC 43197]EOT69477.1 hypothetical protein I585_00943 [Enterococcus malodoratus ATCC 43197]OJG65208.1 hypothetical protein RV07_GL002970 [Enterococcus malodoratus]SPX01118.1 Predicted methylated DNA-protein cysteine methyltransferase [Enterococcus malodoratus]STC71169.1 Predicted methylated DNA-protein cysteine methyltransferase [Enterococcus malodoratus]